MKVHVQAFLLLENEKIEIGSSDFQLDPILASSNLLSRQVAKQFNINLEGFRLDNTALIVNGYEIGVVDDRPRNGLHYVHYYVPNEKRVQNKELCQESEVIFFIFIIKQVEIKGRISK